MKNGRQKGIALITALLILMLTSTMIAGLAWLVMSDQRLGGSNNDRQLAFYGAEAGMEELTASLENAFDANYALNSTAINALMTTPGPPANIPNVQYLAPGSTTAGSGYVIQFTPSAANANLPASSFGTIPAPSPYAGLVGLMTPYTLTVTSHTTYGSEVRLQRQIQTVGIPVFQFGVFSQTDLSFFAGPNFNFGGRVHTNGNLWLAEGDGNTLTLAQKVTAAGEIVTSNLENGWPTTTNYNGAVNITTGSSVANLMAQTPAQSVTGTTNSVGNLGGYAAGFTTVAQTPYNGNIAVAQTGATTLNLAIATPSIGGQPIDLIRLPVKNEDTSAPAKLAERYYSQVSMRILLADYGPSGTCTDSTISGSAGNLPTLSANGAGPTTPVDLASLAWTSTGPPAGNGNTTLPYSAPPAWLTGVGVSTYPLPTSLAAAGTTYSATNGYWVKQYYPIITGCIKIDYQSKVTPGNWTDVTAEILKLGFTGRNINPQVGNANIGGGVHNGVPTNTGAPTPTTGLPDTSATLQTAASGPTANTTVMTVGCQDPSPNAVIRLARLRDNPSTAATTNDWCGNNAGNTVGTWSGLTTRTGTCTVAGTAPHCASTLGTDYWPNVLFDTREGELRDVALPGTTVGTDPDPNGQLTLAGGMYYVELDVSNLARWFAGTIGANGTNAANATGYSVYFSDRRGDQPDPTPPASVGGANAQTGAFGYEDFVNRTSASGCPNGTLEQGEDVESDYTNGVSQNVGTTPRTYGGTPAFDNAGTAQVSTIAALTVAGVLGNNPNCAGPGATFPFATLDHGTELRENPAVLFRRALKLVDGSTITIGTCNSVPCGLTIVAENPVYIQGDYNNPGLNTAFTSTGVGASVIADAVTLLSDNWNDVNSFSWPYCVGISATSVPPCPVERLSADTTYRVAIVGGKGIPFLQPTVGGVGQDFGTDGGTHNFLRYLEDWGNGNPNGTLYYEGSIVSMYYNHQAVGTFKCCTTVYNPPTRAYQFDTNFLTPSLLPPLTPMLRTVNTIGFTQMLLPTQ